MVGACGALLLAGCGTPVRGQSVDLHPAMPAGWVQHRLDGVTVSAPASWRVGPYVVCGLPAADTIGAATDDLGNLGPKQAVSLGVTNCPAERVTATTVSPSDSWVEVDCTVVSAVVLPSGPFLGTFGPQRTFDRTSAGYDVVGKGQAISVSAGSSAIARRVLATIAPTGGRCSTT